MRRNSAIFGRLRLAQLLKLLMVALLGHGMRGRNYWRWVRRWVVLMCMVRRKSDGSKYQV
jgi:hypothetical protein